MEEVKRYRAAIVPRCSEETAIGKRFNQLVHELVKEIPNNDERERGFKHLEIAMACFNGAVIKSAPGYARAGDVRVPIEIGSAPCRG